VFLGIAGILEYICRARNEYVEGEQCFEGEKKTRTDFLRKHKMFGYTISSPAEKPLHFLFLYLCPWLPV
jgi:hypothetical protein